MNRITIALAAWVMVGLELGLAPLLAPGSGSIRPGFLLPLAVFVALQAPPRATLWTAVLLGLLADLLAPHVLVDGALATIPGPHALGYALAAQFVLSVRGMVIQRSPLTMTVLSVFAAAIACAVVVALYTVRSFYPEPIDFAPTRTLLTGLASAAYTGVSAFFLSFIFFGLAPLFGLAAPGFRSPPPGRVPRTTR